jgi:hypothetical protein
MNKIMYDLVRFNKHGEQVIEPCLSWEDCERKRLEAIARRKKGEFFSIQPRVTSV